MNMGYFYYWLSIVQGYPESTSYTILLQNIPGSNIVNTVQYSEISPFHQPLVEDILGCKESSPSLFWIHSLKADQADNTKHKNKTHLWKK